MKKILVTCIVLFAVIACAPKILVPTASHESEAKKKIPDITLAQMQKGHEIYIARCGTCHKLIKPTEYSDQKWEKILPVMSKKAKLIQTEYDLVHRYVFGVRAATGSK